MEFFNELKVHIANNDINKVNKVFNQILNAKITPTIKIYNLMITFYATSNSPEKAYKFFDHMFIMKLKPTIDTYNALLLSVPYDIDKLYCHIYLYNRDNIIPNEQTHYNLITAYIQEGSIEKAEKLYEFIFLVPNNYIRTENFIKIQEVIYITIIKVYFGRKEINKAINLFTITDSKNIGLKNYAYALMLKSYEKTY